MRIGEWKTRSVVQRYDIVDGRDLTERHEKLEHRKETKLGHVWQFGGWKTRSVFQRYDIVNNRDIADAMRKLEHSQKNQFGHVSVTFGSSDDPKTTTAASMPVS